MTTTSLRESCAAFSSVTNSADTGSPGLKRPKFHSRSRGWLDSFSAKPTNFASPVTTWTMARSTTTAPWFSSVKQCHQRLAQPLVEAGGHRWSLPLSFSPYCSSMYCVREAERHDAQNKRAHSKPVRTVPGAGHGAAAYMPGGGSGRETFDGGLQGRRSVALDPATVAALRQHQARQLAERLAAGEAIRPETRFLSTRRGCDLRRC